MKAITPISPSGFQSPNVKEMEKEDDSGSDAVIAGERFSSANLEESPFNPISNPYSQKFTNNIPAFDFKPSNQAPKSGVKTVGATKSKKKDKLKFSELFSPSNAGLMMQMVSPHKP